MTKKLKIDDVLAQHIFQVND